MIRTREYRTTLAAPMSVGVCLGARLDARVGARPLAVSCSGPGGDV